MVLSTQGSGGNFHWKPSQVGLPVLANGDPYRPLLVDFYNYKRCAIVAMGCDPYCL